MERTAGLTKDATRPKISDALCRLSKPPKPLLKPTTSAASSPASYLPHPPYRLENLWRFRPDGVWPRAKSRAK